MVFSYILLLMPYLVYTTANDGLLPILKCSTWDSACQARLIQTLLPILAAGIPDMGTKRLDPLRVPYVHGNQGGTKIDMENYEMHGLGKSIVEKASWDVFSKQFRVRLTIPVLTINATYVASGYLHTLPFNGKGDMYVRSSDVEIDIIWSYDEREDNKGRKFAEINNYFYTFDVNGGSMYMFNNLYDGDQTQSAATHAYLHKNWKAMSAEYGRIHLDALIDAGMNVVKTLLHMQPLQTFINDY